MAIAIIFFALLIIGTIYVVYANTVVPRQDYTRARKQRGDQPDWGSFTTDGSSSNEDAD